MRGSFFGLNISVSGLLAAQRNLDVVNHNINNVNTPGYSRQEGLQRAENPIPLLDGTGMVGTGSRIYAVKRIRDEYLDYKFWSESKSVGEMEAKMIGLADIEAYLNEPSDAGYNKIMDKFYDGLQELSKDPGNDAIRALVRENGVTLAKYFNSTAAHLEKLQADLNDKIKSKAEEVNTLAKRIRELNKQIYTFEVDGSAANDLRDQRTVLVDKLSKLVNVEAYEVTVGKLCNGADNKHFVVTISGKALVDHYDVSPIKVEKRANKLNEEDIDGLYELSWADGNMLTIRGGEIKGYFDVRDGNDGQDVDTGYTGPFYKSPNYEGVPYYQRKLNEFVREFARVFNEGRDSNSDGDFNDAGDIKGHVLGYGLDPDGSGALAQTSGMRFFTRLDGTTQTAMSSTAFTTAQYANLTAKNFCVSKDVMENPRYIATADATGQIENTNILKSLIDTKHFKSMFLEGEPGDFMKSLVVSVGVNTQYAETIAKNQSAIIEHIENKRLSISGVSLDEEMSNMVKFQQAYNASARMIVTMGEVYDTLINRLGVR